MSNLDGVDEAARILKRLDLPVNPEILAFSEEMRRSFQQMSAQGLLPAVPVLDLGIAPDLSGFFGPVSETLSAANNQRWLASVTALNAGLAQSLALQPTFDPSWLRQALGVEALIKQGADSLSQAILPLSNMRWMEASLATPLISSRLLDLANSFATPLSGVGSPFGKLHQLVSADSPVRDALDRAVAATQVPGTFGFDTNGLRRASDDLTDLLAERPTMQDEIEVVWADVQDASGLTDEVLFDFTNTLGLVRAVRSHRPTGPAIVLGFTVGLLTFVAGAVVVSDTPTSLVAAATAGGGIYYFANRKIKKATSD